MHCLILAAAQGLPPGVPMPMVPPMMVPPPMGLVRPGMVPPPMGMPGKSVDDHGLCLPADNVQCCYG